MVNIRYQEQMNNPWTITVENGIWEVVTSNIGGVSIKSGSYKSIASVTMYLPKSEMIKKMIEVRDNIRDFETTHRKDMENSRLEYKKKLSNDTAKIYNKKELL